MTEWVFNTQAVDTKLDGNVHGTSLYIHILKQTKAALEDEVGTNDKETS